MGQLYPDHVGMIRQAVEYVQRNSTGVEPAERFHRRTIKHDGHRCGIDEFPELRVYLGLGFRLRTSRIPDHGIGAPDLFQVSEIAAQRPHTHFPRGFFTDKFPHTPALLRIRAVRRNRARTEALVDRVPDIVADGVFVQAHEVRREGRQDQTAQTFQIVVRPVLFFRRHRLSGNGRTGCIGRLANLRDSRGAYRAKSDASRKLPSIHSTHHSTHPRPV